MLQFLSDQIRHCYARAAESQRRAAEAADPFLQCEFESIEEGWLRLAESCAVSERLQGYLFELDAKTADKGEWHPVASAPFDRAIEIAVIRDPTPHAVAFACRRVLGGWLNAESGERIEVHPTHWREWA